MGTAVAQSGARQEPSRHGRNSW